MKRDTYVSRSAYQKLAEENKRLLKDLETISVGKEIESFNVISKWHSHFCEIRRFNDMLKSYCTNRIQDKK